MGWSLGANDSANIFGTGVATGIVKYRVAIWLTACFVLLGALAEGPKCMKTLTELSSLAPLDAFGCTLAAALTMTVLTHLAIPASASQAVVGALLGAGLFSASADFTKLYKIVSCWILTPLGAIVVACILHKLLQCLLDRRIRSITRRNWFYYGGIMAAGCYGAYSLGANNVANVTGVYVGSGTLTAEAASLLGGVSIALGVLTYSKKIMMTVGKGIVPLDPFSALVVVLAEAVTLHLFTQVRVPVSSSQAVVGAVVGVGIMRDLRTVNPRMLVKIAAGWLLTPVFAALGAFGLIWALG